MLPVRLLLVEDNDRDARITEIALSEILTPSFKVTRARSFQEAEAALGAGAQDVVLLDLNLPDSMGLDTLHRMAGVVELPVIVLTGLEDEDMGIEALRAGAQDFLVKGHMFGALLQRAIRYAMERHRLLMELKG